MLWSAEKYTDWGPGSLFRVPTTADSYAANLECDVKAKACEMPAVQVFNDICFTESKKYKKGGEIIIKK